jgi:DNA processing protein
VVKSYYPVLALLLAGDVGQASCFRLPRDVDAAFDMLHSKAGRDALAHLIGKPIGEVPWDVFDRQVEAITECGIGVITFFDAEYPSYLRDIAKAPPILFFKGDLGWLDRRGIAIVGSRSATVKGCAFARRLAGDLAALGIVVTSGVARGIDAAAHWGALERGGPTIGVVGTGLDVVYPRENRKLLERIVENGCLLSEQIMGTPPQGFVFPLRNRVISGVSRAVVVVEAAERSGALITAQWAIEQGRDVGAVPGFPGDARSRGTNRLIKTGAFAVESAADVLEAVPILQEDIRGSSPGGRRDRTRTPDAAGDIQPMEQAVLDALGASGADPDALSRHLQRPVSDLQRVLFDLEMQGVVARDASGMYYRL